MRLVADLNEGKPEPRVAVMDSSVRVMLKQLPAPFASQRSKLPAPTLETANTLCLGRAAGRREVEERVSAPCTWASKRPMTQIGERKGEGQREGSKGNGNEEWRAT